MIGSVRRVAIRLALGLGLAGLGAVPASADTPIGKTIATTLAFCSAPGRCTDTIKFSVYTSPKGRVYSFWNASGGMELELGKWHVEANRRDLVTVRGNALTLRMQQTSPNGTLTASGAVTVHGSTCTAAFAGDFNGTPVVSQTGPCTVAEGQRPY